jgi:hypothetical protein
MKNSKRRGEWAELQFMAKAAKYGLRISKPWGELARYDMVIETGGRFLRVQIKSTMHLRSKGCYVCGVRPCKTSKPYQRGEFDFLAAYVIPKDVWYIIPSKVVVHGKRTGIPLYTSSPTGKYEAYKEAWHLLGAGEGGNSCSLTAEMPSRRTRKAGPPVAKDRATRRGRGSWQRSE